MLSDIKAVAARGFKLGTSVIVGFPSETLAELEDTIKLCNEVNFDWVWCHGFSPRPGTAAFALPGQLPAEEILERVGRLQAGIHRRGAVMLDFE
jgi:tRNA-2-methylthio-N6-dimethylallyladenosine synthase